jgi:anaerobic magnesium-protoporphyrin IX monomethyl ester cyclase
MRQADALLISLFNYESFPVRTLYAALKAEGFDVDTIFLGDLKDFRLRQRPLTDKEVGLVLKAIQQIAPRFIGISLRSMYLQEATELTRRIREELNIPVMWGGTHAILCAEESIQIADMVCTGEGEEPLIELCRDPERTDIESLWFRKNRTLIRNNQRPLMQDLDWLPLPDFEHEHKWYIENETLKTGDPIIRRITNHNYNFMSTRGCPFKCSYCSNTALKNTLVQGKEKFIRQRGLDLIFEELNYVKERFRVTSFSSNDEVFGQDYSWLKLFAERYEKEINLPFHCDLHPAFITERNLKVLKRMKLMTATVGIQSGDEYVRTQVYMRNTSDTMLIEKAHLLKEYGITPNFDFIVGNPLEPNNGLLEVVQLLKKFPRPFRTNIYLLRYLPRTALSERMLNEGYIKNEQIEGSKKIHEKRIELIYNVSLQEDSEVLFFTNILYLLSTGITVRTHSGAYNFFLVPNFLIELCLTSKLLHNIIPHMTWFIRYTYLASYKLGVEVEALYFQISRRLKFSK